MQSKDPPIGYWLRLVDTLLTKGINETLAEFGLSRTEWQVMHSIAEHHTINFTDLESLSKPFVDTQSLSDILFSLKRNGLINTDTGSKLSLSEKGTALHQRCLGKQQSFRAKAISGISSADYEQVVSTLQKMADNIRQTNTAF
jgi:DNA-binding MarR family transcriptional regulator